jgi:predicted NBD/HSP70 family sugar kinase
MATPAIAREINALKTLKALLELGPMSRADVAREVGLTRTTMTHVTSHLFEDGYLKEYKNEYSDNKIGRPGVKIGINPSSAYFLGAELTIDRITISIMDLSKNIVSVDTIERDFQGMPIESVLDELQKIVFSLCGRNLPNDSNIQGLGLAFQGFLARGGIVVGGPLVEWRNVRIMSALQSRFTFPLAVDNDANLSAFAEWYLTPDLHQREILSIRLETGVGVGMISEGRIVRGAHGLAGEIGYIQIAEQPNGAFGSRPLLLQDAIGKPTLLKAFGDLTKQNPTVENLIKSIKDKNPGTLEIIRTWGKWLARGIMPLIYTHDPDDIIIGGDLSVLFHHVQDDVTNELTLSIADGFPIPRLLRSRFQSNVGAIGAAAFMHQSMFKLLDAREQR